MVRSINTSQVTGVHHNKRLMQNRRLELATTLVCYHGLPWFNQRFDFCFFSKIEILFVTPSFSKRLFFFSKLNCFFVSPPFEKKFFPQIFLLYAYLFLFNLHILVKFIFLYRDTAVSRRHITDWSKGAHAFFGYGSDPTWLENVTCVGNETNLLDCNLSDWGESSSGHNEDVGIDCEPRE